MIERRDYVAADLPETRIYPSEFESGEFDTEIINRIRMTVKVEEPITKDLLERRIRNSFGFYAMGRDIRAKFEEMLNRSGLHRTFSMGQVVLWYSEPKDNLEFFRVRSEDRNRFRQVPAIEIESAMRYVSGIVDPQADLETVIGITRIVLGFSRMSSDMRSMLESIYPGIFD